MMIISKKIILLTTIFYTFQVTFANALENSYIFGLRLQDNNYEIIPKIENKFQTKVPIISIIYDNFEDEDIIKLARTFKNLGKDKVYHVDVNPFGYSLKELIEDPNHMGWEKKYRNLFKLIKKYDVKVIFRFLHEMNGGWYSWASDPLNFKIFWKMVWNWSREEGLGRGNILFDFSVNSQDLPATETGSLINQQTQVFPCNQDEKMKIGCLTFEDFYPGDEFIDTVGVTMYNWGKGARSENWASWRTPEQVINETGYWTLDRLKKIGKPIFIDEAGTTSINIHGTGAYNSQKIIEIYDEYHSGTTEKLAFGTNVKNDWIKQLHELLLTAKIIGGVYFNADVTNGLRDRSQIGELDWTAIDPDKNILYPGILEILFDPKNIQNPQVYFDLPKKLVENKKWINHNSMLKINEFMSTITDFEEGKVVSDPEFPGLQANMKYQYYLEKFLESDPFLCSVLKKSFPEIECKLLEIGDYSNKLAALKLIIKNNKNAFDKVRIKEKIDNIKENIKFIYKGKSNILLQNKIEGILSYFEFYEKNYLN